MPVTMSWKLASTPQPAAAEDVQQNPFDRDQRVSADSFLGHGLVRPLRRDGKSDFAHERGEALVRAAVGQILGTQCSSEFAQGELPWRPEFGSLLYRLRHQNNDIALQELSRVYVVDALKRWEPRVRVKRVITSRKQKDGLNVLDIRITYDIVSPNVNGAVLVPDVEQVITS